MKNKKLIKVITTALIIAMLSAPVGYAENEKTIYDSELVTKETITKISPDDKEKDAIYTIDGYRLSSIEELMDDESVIEAYMDRSANEINSSSYPTRLDNAYLFPPPEQNGQGRQNSCVAWAVAYAAVSHEEKNKWEWSSYSRNHCFSPAFVFNSLTDGGEGLSISEAMKFIVRKGVCSLTVMDYSAGTLTSPNSRQKKVASYFKAGSWKTIRGTNAVKKELNEGHGVVIGFVPPANYSSANNVTYGNETLGDGGHAVCIVGYDDDLYGGAFKYLNSYGSGWGQNGYGWITYEAFNSKRINHHGSGVGYVIKKGTDKSLRTNMGDVDFSGSVTAADSRLILRYCSRLETYTDEQFVRSDIDGSGSLTSSDAQFVLRYASNLETVFPYFR